jgi:hypothetical protein
MLNLIMGFIYEGLVGSGRRNPNLTKLCSCLYLSAADLFIILRAMKFSDAEALVPMKKVQFMPPFTPKMMPKVQTLIAPVDI